MLTCTIYVTHNSVLLLNFRSKLMYQKIRDTYQIKLSFYFYLVATKGWNPSGDISTQAHSKFVVNWVSFVACGCRRLNVFCNVSPNWFSAVTNWVPKSHVSISGTSFFVASILCFLIGLNDLFIILLSSI